MPHNKLPEKVDLERTMNKPCMGWYVLRLVGLPGYPSPSVPGTALALFAYRLPCVRRRHRLLRGLPPDGRGSRTRSLA